MAISIKTVRVLLNDTDGNQDITIPGFGTPKAALFKVVNADTNNTLEPDYVLSDGFTDGTNQATISTYARDNVASPSTRRRQRTDSVISLSGLSGNVGTASFVSWITDGVRINITGITQQRFVIVTFITGDSVLEALVGTHNLSTIPVTITTGFEASLIFFNSSGLSTPSGEDTNSIYSEGIAVNKPTIVQKTSLMNCRNNTDRYRYFSTSAPTGQVFAASLTWLASVSEFTSTGFRLVGTEGNDYINYLAIKFASNVDFELQEIDLPISTGVQQLGSVGFTPEFSFILGTPVNNPNSVQSATESKSYIFADGDRKYCHSLYSVQGVATADSKSYSSDSNFELFSTQSTKHYSGTIGDQVEGGVEVNFSTVDATSRKAYGLFIANLEEITDVQEGTSYIFQQEERIKYIQDSEINDKYINVEDENTLYLN